MAGIRVAPFIETSGGGAVCITFSGQGGDVSHTLTPDAARRLGAALIRDAITADGITAAVNSSNQQNQPRTLSDHRRKTA